MSCEGVCEEQHVLAVCLWTEGRKQAMPLAWHHFVHLWYVRPRHVPCSSGDSGLLMQVEGAAVVLTSLSFRDSIWTETAPSDTEVEDKTKEHQAPILPAFLLCPHQTIIELHFENSCLPKLNFFC